MRTADHKNRADRPATELDVAWEASRPISHKAYHEMADQPVHETDALTQLESNVRSLEDLQGRLSFLMREVRYLMKA